MIKNYEISSKESLKIREAMKATKTKTIYRRLEVLALLSEGNTPSEISRITKYHEKYIRILGIKYNKEGIEKFLVDGRKGGNHKIMQDDQAAEFLTSFEEKAKRGEIITISEIAIKLDEVTNKERKSLSTTYYFLHRHGWRKIMPRSQHPKKASDEVIDTSKKLT